MKMIFVVIVNEIHGKYYAIVDTIKTGENLISILNRYNTDICHLCESRKDAERIATEWNNQYKRSRVASPPGLVNAAGQTVTSSDSYFIKWRYYIMTIKELKNRRVIVGKTSISCKDDRGKTCGIVRNVKAWGTLSTRELYDFHKAVGASGIRAAGLCGNLIVDGKQLYYLHDLKPIEFYENYIDGKIENNSEKEYYNLRKQLAENAINHGIIVISCYIIK